MKQLAVILFIVGLVGCNDQGECTKKVSKSVLNSVNPNQLIQDIAIIDAYLENEEIPAIEDPSGMRYLITQSGSGSTPCLEDNISFTYRGKLLNGIVFDETTTPITYPLNNLILGWKIILPKLEKGTKATLFIPSGYGYGSQSSASIPANSNLIFEIELVSF